LNFVPAPIFIWLGRFKAKTERLRVRAVEQTRRSGLPMRALLAGVVLTMATAGFGTWNTWVTYRGFQNIANVELRLDRLSGTIVHLDEVLTMSARMCAVTGGPEWEARYRHFEPVLDDAIKETIAIAPDEVVRKAATRTDVANIRLVEMEYESFDLVREGRHEDARRLLFSKEYDEQKAIYAEAITEPMQFSWRSPPTSSNSPHQPTS